MNSITVITITHNNLEELKKTLRSYQTQTSVRKKIIVIDGDSSDGTKDWLKNCDIKGLTFLSQKDKGISDAFNKGVNQANSEWICFLNSGDIFASDDVLESIEEDILKIDTSNHNVIAYQAKTSPTNKIFPMKVDLSSPENRSMISHQASIIKKNAFNEFGLFDLNYSFRMDYELFLRIFKKSAPHFIPRVAVIYDVKGRSSKLSNRPRFIFEGIIAEYLVLKKNNWHLVKSFYLVPKDFLKKILSYSYYRLKYNLDLF